MDVSATQATTYHDIVPHPDSGVSVSWLREVGQLAGGAGAHHLHWAQLNVSVPGVVVVTST